MSGRAIAVAGLAFEARIAAGPGVAVVCGAGEALRLALARAIAGGADGILSFGIAGGLDPSLGPGTLVVASEVIGDAGRWPADPAWSRRLLDRLPDARHAAVAGADAPVATTLGKAALHHRTGAAAVDMESHLAAAAAADHGLPFAALRAIADPAGCELPRAALAGQRPDGRTDPLAVLRALLGRPGELPALLRVALAAGRARRALLRGRRRLGPGLGLLDLGQLPLDVR